MMNTSMALPTSMFPDVIKSNNATGKNPLSSSFNARSQPESLLGMATSLFEVEAFARNMRVPDESSELQPRPSHPPSRPEEITSQVLAELSGDLFFEDEDFDSSLLEPVPVNRSRMNIVDSIPPVNSSCHLQQRNTSNQENHPSFNSVQEQQSSFPGLDSCLAHAFKQEQNFGMSNSLLPVQQSQSNLVTPTNQFQQLKRQMAEISSQNSNVQTGSIPDDTQPVNKKQRVAEDPEEARRFRPYQAEQWTEKFEELCQFRKQKGHCCVPHTYKENPALARWVKRQRYQYKLKNERKQSTMTDERVVALEKIGFIWDSHGAAWEDRLNELREYRQAHGHCNVPSNFPSNPQLATWVKCQRRQYKLFWDGKTSNMTLSRISELEKLGFEWELRGSKSSLSTTTASSWHV